ncbi:MAG: sugar ABC transporter substrate-binding protein [Candidatus Margulisbacteria bacterium]|nr:sugar ABC transporter substrate-binding protein [Candidatus Margulisiibacteriota bacterium]MBU1021227.1 sugar ABC transporter substrate-binding protein [Candidatus Margulisiibacteriota bacterium]MBU1729833.1 sugar ABC transporter substrate-binding protein [Candidatus Margulisiibacteriota bacterium]MBU1955334.1 sugar ABC transporter substrate-binding protein [Candidatus Margulisiibacteriota bacterium]
MLKKFLLIVLILMAAFVISSCAEEEKGPVTLNIWIMPNSLEPVTDLENIFKDFEKENPDIKVKVTSVDWGAAWTKITTAATSNDVPDIVQLGSTWVGSISSMNALWDMKDRVDEIGGPSAFVPAAWSTHGLSGADQVTAIPWIVDARAMYYRTDVFNKLGLTSKDLNDWNSFVNALEKIKTANLVIDGVKVAPLGISGKNDWNVIHNLAPWIWGAGGDFVSKDNKKSLLDSKQAFNGVVFYVDLVKKGFVPLEYLELNSAQVSSNFNQGAVAIYFDGPYEVKTLTTPPQQGGAAGSVASRNFNVAPYPKGPKGRYTFIGGSNLAIFKASKHKEQAWRAIKHLMKKESQISYAKVTGFLPSRMEAFNDPYITANQQRKVFKEAIKYGKTYPCIPAWGVLEPILTRRFGIMWDYVTGSSIGVQPEEIAKQLKLAAGEADSVLSQTK